MSAGGLDIHWRMNVLVCQSPNVDYYTLASDKLFLKYTIHAEEGREGEYTQQFISPQVIILSVDVRGRRIFWLLYR